MRRSVENITCHTYLLTYLLFGHIITVQCLHVLLLHVVEFSVVLRDYFFWVVSR